MADGVTWAGAAQSFMPALIGGIIGSGSTILAGWLAWKRERADRNEAAQREAKAKAEEAREAHRRERATALTDGLAEATTAMFEAASASDRARRASSTSATAPQASRESVAKANTAIYRLLSLTRDDAVRAAIGTTARSVAGGGPSRLDDMLAQTLVRQLTDAVLAEHDALQPIASKPAG